MAMTPLQEDMLNACTYGDVEKLRGLFDSNVQKGSRPIYLDSPDGPPPVSVMLGAAISHGHKDVVSFLLQIYNSQDRKDRIKFYEPVCTELLHHPNVEILELLYDYDNSIINEEWDSQGITTFVTEACKQPPEKIRKLLHFLIEHDADLQVGGLANEMPVCYALYGDQSIDVIEAMIRKGSPVTFEATRQAIYRERIDAIEAFIRIGVEHTSEYGQELRKEAEKTGNVEVMKLVNSWTSDWGKKSVQAGLIFQKVKSIFKDLNIKKS
ncbi:hypothetical protein BS50DRAFT_216488 [Corynespora cassiicola Philippines]|uniref:Ankyrin n=1 Tax=Corynespora cassiicola Philippines TaxID=1448308 RepID=A0A2T2N3J9_CORCC|nr:hypothetical protein BS50DRAFT_216488 [Corynespora cassiicola Philippines]